MRRKYMRRRYTIETRRADHAVTVITGTMPSRTVRALTEEDFALEATVSRNGEAGPIVGLIRLAGLNEMTARQARALGRQLIQMARWVETQKDNLENDAPRANPRSFRAVEQTPAPEPWTPDQAEAEGAQLMADGWNQGIVPGQRVRWMRPGAWGEHMAIVASQAHVAKHGRRYEPSVYVSVPGVRLPALARLDELRLVDPEEPENADLYAQDERTAQDHEKQWNERYPTHTHFVWRPMGDEMRQCTIATTNKAHTVQIRPDAFVACVRVETRRGERKSVALAEIYSLASPNGAVPAIDAITRGNKTRELTEVVSDWNGKVKPGAGAYYRAHPDDEPEPCTIMQPAWIDEREGQPHVYVAIQMKDRNHHVRLDRVII